VYRYQRHPLLLVQVNIENKDILCCLYTHLITDINVHCLTVLFIPAKNLDDTKTIFDNQATNLVMHDCS
jgi:hypothetical protein